jgi:Na+-driven multidrug efflux pump
MMRFMVIIPTYFICGLMDVFCGGLRALDRSVTAMIISLCGACGFRILWIATVFKAYNESPLSVYISYPISWSLTAGFHLLFMIFAAKKLLRENRERNDFIETKNLGGSKNELA